MNNIRKRNIRKKFLYRNKKRGIGAGQAAT